MKTWLSSPLVYLAPVSAALAAYLAYSEKIWRQLDGTNVAHSAQYTLFVPFTLLLMLGLWLCKSGLAQFTHDISEWEKTCRQHDDESYKGKDADSALMESLEHRRRAQLRNAMLGFITAVVGSFSIPLTHLVVMPFIAHSAAEITKAL